MSFTQLKKRVIIITIMGMKAGPHQPGKDKKAMRAPKLSMAFFVSSAVDYLYHGDELDDRV